MFLSGRFLVFVYLWAASLTAASAYSIGSATYSVCEKTKIALANDISNHTINFTHASQNALNVKQRRDRIRILPDQKLVRFKGQFESNRVLILGGKEAFPM